MSDDYKFDTLVSMRAMYPMRSTGHALCKFTRQHPMSFGIRIMPQHSTTWSLVGISIREFRTRPSPCLNSV